MFGVNVEGPNLELAARVLGSQKGEFPFFSFGDSDRREHREG